LAPILMTKAPATQADYPLDSPLDFLQRLWRLNRALEKLSSRMEKRFGVSAQQRLLIRCVGQYPAMTPGELASVLHVDPGTVSAALKRLEDKQLIRRRRDARDKRRVTLALSAKGRALARPSAYTVEHAVERLLAATKASDLETTQALLAKLTRYLDAENG
jgi:DNA-binding MarR family transcriptional regulator